MGNHIHFGRLTTTPASCGVLFMSGTNSDKYMVACESAVTGAPSVNTSLHTQGTAMQE